MPPFLFVLPLMALVSAQDHYVLNGFREMACGFSEESVCRGLDGNSIQYMETEKTGCVDLCTVAAGDPTDLVRQLELIKRDAGGNPNEANGTISNEPPFLMGMNEYPSAEAATPPTDPPAELGVCDRDQYVTIISYHEIPLPGQLDYLEFMVDSQCTNQGVDDYNVDRGAPIPYNEGVQFGLFQYTGTTCSFTAYSLIDITKAQIDALASNNTNNGLVHYQLSETQKSKLTVQDDGNKYHWGVVMLKSGIISWPSWADYMDDTNTYWCIGSYEGQAAVEAGDSVVLPAPKNKRHARNIQMRSYFIPY